MAEQDFFYQKAKFHQKNDFNAGGIKKRQNILTSWRLYYTIIYLVQNIILFLKHAQLFVYFNT